MKAIIAGTFDPFTVGHRDITERALAVFGSAIIAVAYDTGKNALPLADRLEIAERSVDGLSNITIEPFSGLLSEYLSAHGDCVLVRGIRNTRDAEYERDISRVYASLCGKETVFFVTRAEYEHVSSSVVRELVKLGAELDGYVVPSARQYIENKYAAKA